MDSRFDASKKSGNDGQDARLAESFLIETRRSQNVSNFFEETKQEYQSMHIGQSFERYTIQEELGRGGMGIVYKAFDTKLKRTVALKVILHGEEKDIQRFERESSAMAQLDHHNIVKLYDFGISPQPFFTMEYIEGFTLADLIKEKKVNPDFLLDLLIKVCDALAHAHKHKILHRDIKPSNIMITKNGEPKIMDFGLAKIFKSDEKRLSKTGDILGSVNYMPPEQLNGKTTERSDIYSLGATMYEALTYRNVYQGDSTHDILFQLLQSDPIPPRRLNPTLSPYFEAICLKCIAKKEHKRYRGFKQLVRELKNFKAHKPILAKKYTSWNTFTNFVHRHKVIVSAISFAFTVLVVSLVFAIKTERQTRQTLDQTFETLEYVMRNHKFLREDKKLGKMFAKIFSDNAKYVENEKWSLLKGYVLSMDAKEEKNIVFFDREIANNPNNSIAYVDRGNIYFNLGKHQKALHDYNEAIRIEDRNFFAYNSRGLYYSEFYQYGQALADYNKAISIEPNYYEVYINRGNLYHRQRKPQKAIEDFNKACMIEPENPVAHARRGAVYASTEKYELAHKNFKRAIELDSQNFQPYLLRGNLYTKTKEYTKAEADFEKAMLLAPKNLDVYLNRAVFYYLSKKYKKAEADFEKAMLLAPQKSDVYLMRGKIYGRLEQYKKAKADFERLVSLYPTTASYMHRGWVLHQLGQYKKAIADYNKVLSLDANHALAYYSRGGVYNKLGQYEKAIIDLDKAIMLVDISGDFYSRRGVSHYKLENHDKAIADFTKAIQFDSREGYFRRGVLYLELEQYKKSEADLNKTISLYKNHVYAYFYRGKLYAAMENYEKAIADFHKFCLLQPKNIHGYLNLGIIYHHLKKYKQSITEYEKVLGHWRAHHGLYQCYRDLKNESKAQYHFQKYQELRK
ncbi:tetratricopeptide repeat protein [Candidatus Uabimicrobium amorphum]|uniref:Protein kinase n=1 Tax=Uabimicrobium amorphum TaxID=2596890 RepID=A0A5S9ILM4_UABAM|nr:serine/threonine-protein kinase [Candidatus Uabimicrobium amorphum]BBM82845.1 protein kinase [Candidatus Uabimicrobium amorphum]